MNNSEEILNELIEESGNLEEVGGEGIPENSINTEKFLIFSMMDRLYAFQSKHISEIALFDAVYPLPLMPNFVLGVINRYSVPYALFDISLLFHNTPTPQKKVLIIKDEIDRIAFLVEEVNGIADIQTDKLLVKDRSLESNDLADSVSASFDWMGEDVLVLDIHNILSRVTGDLS